METFATSTDDDDLADLAELILNVAREIRSRRPGDDDRVIHLSWSEAHVMRFVDHHPGAAPSDVAEATGLHRSNLSTALRSLAAHGLIERRTDPADRRGVNLFPTALAASNLALVRADWARHLATTIGENRAAVPDALALLRRLEDGLIAGRQG
ncbi:MAG: MarR family transcriptional regulator [Mycobacterium sp.]